MNLIIPDATERAAAERQLELTDANMGREWDSPHGRQKIVRIEIYGARINYAVSTIGTDQIRMYGDYRIEETIERDQYKLTPEYAKDCKDREEQAALLQQRETKEAEQLSKQLAEIAAFTASMRPMTAGKVRAALLKLHIFRGQTLSLKQLTETLVSAGEPLEIRQEWVIQEMTRTRFNRASEREQRDHERRRQEKGKMPFYYVGNYRLGKTAYDYANFLKSRQPATA